MLYKTWNMEIIKIARIKQGSLTEVNNSKKKRAWIRKQMKIRSTMEENKRQKKVGMRRQMSKGGSHRFLLSIWQLNYENMRDLEMSQRDLTEKHD